MSLKLQEQLGILLSTNLENIYHNRYNDEIEPYT